VLPVVPVEPVLRLVPVDPVVPAFPVVPALPVVPVLPLLPVVPGDDGACVVMFVVEPGVLTGVDLVPLNTAKAITTMTTIAAMMPMIIPAPIPVAAAASSL